MKQVLLLLVAIFLSCVSASKAVAAQDCSRYTTAPSTPTSRFIIENGTVFDTKTKLLWKHCAEGQVTRDNECMGEVSNVSWKHARAITDQDPAWRLPTIKELQSIVEDNCISPAINLSVFPNTPNASFWSSTDGTYSFTGMPWYLDFGSGTTKMASEQEAAQHRKVRLVSTRADFTSPSFNHDLYKSEFSTAKTRSEIETYIEKYSSNDPDKLVDEARKKLKKLKYNTYRQSYAKAKDTASITEWDFFIVLYNDYDPDHLVPRAKAFRDKMYEQESRRRQLDQKAAEAQEMRRQNSIMADVAKLNKAKEELLCAQALQLLESLLKRSYTDISYNHDQCMYDSLFKSRDPQQMYLAAGQYESKGKISDAKQVYKDIVSRFPISAFAVKATDRLTKMSDVEAVERSNRAAAEAIERSNQSAAYGAAAAVDRLRSQNYNQCMNDRTACWSRCRSLYKKWSDQDSCQNACQLCSQ